jgi:putative oxidoreductase
MVMTFLLRWLLVLLFFPFSALDKIINFSGAVAQARGFVKVNTLAVLMIVAGLGVEIFCSLAIISGIADRAAALVLAVYCVATACLFKEFWRPGDFWRAGDSAARNLFWDFLKNLSLAGGILLITFGTGPVSVRHFLANPLASSHPYAQHPGDGK